MATSRQVLEMVLAGRNAARIAAELHLPPSKLMRALSARRTARLLEAQALAADIAQGLRAGELVKTAMDQLARLTAAPNAETARKACMTIMATARASHPAGGSPPASDSNPPLPRGAVPCAP